MVQFGGVLEPAYTSAHYAAAPDARDRDGREFANRTERVKAELWMPPRWRALYLQCWAQIVDKWCDPAWEENHNARREWRLLMRGAPYHQGNLNLAGYAARWSVTNDGPPCSQFKAYALAHKSKAIHSVDYNPDDPPSAYSNETIHSRLDGYTSMAKTVHEHA